MTNNISLEQWASEEIAAAEQTVEYWREKCEIMQGEHNALEAKVRDLKDGAIKSANEIEQTLGIALGYPWYKDDFKSFPNATVADGVCVGDNVPESLAAEAADRIQSLTTQLEEARAERERDVYWQ